MDPKKKLMQTLSKWRVNKKIILDMSDSFHHVGAFPKPNSELMKTACPVRLIPDLIKVVMMYPKPHFYIKGKPYLRLTDKIITQWFSYKLEPELKSPVAPNKDMSHFETLAKLHSMLVKNYDKCSFIDGILLFSTNARPVKLSKGFSKIPKRFHDVFLEMHDWLKTLDLESSIPHYASIEHMEFGKYRMKMLSLNVNGKLVYFFVDRMKDHSDLPYYA